MLEQPSIQHSTPSLWTGDSVSSFARWCLCVHVCVCVCVFVCLRAQHTHARAHTHTHTRAHTRTHTLSLHVSGCVSTVLTGGLIVCTLRLAVGSSWAALMGFLSATISLVVSAQQPQRHTPHLTAHLFVSPLLLTFYMACIPRWLFFLFHLLSDFPSCDTFSLENGMTSGDCAGYEGLQ